MKAPDLTNKPFEVHVKKLEGRGIERTKSFDIFLTLAIDGLMLKDERIDNFEVYQDMFVDLIWIMEKSAQESSHKVADDYLGEFFMQHITGGENGQFFTPQNISDFMAQIILDKPSEGEIIDKLTVADPSGCGSGRMLLAAAKVMGKRNIKVIGIDLDRRCCQMSVINMFMNGIDADILWMNGLSGEFFGGWSIRMFPIPRITPIDKISEPAKEAIKEAVIKQEEVKKQQEQWQQLSLF